MAATSIATPVDSGLGVAIREVRHRSLRRLRRNPRGLIGAAILALMILAALFADVLALRPPDLPDPQAPLRPPFTGYLLGTDYLGRDIYSRVLFAARYTLAVGVLTAVLSVTVGIIAGSIAGYYGGRADTIVSKIVDIMLSFPSVPFLMLLGSITKVTPPVLVAGIALFQWMTVSRLVRAEFLSLRERDFISAAHVIGVPAGRIMFVHLLPNAVAPIAVATALVVANAILIESSLSFLGFGINPPTPTWGNMLTNAQSYVRIAPWMAITPGILITLCVTSVVFVGDALREAFDPRLAE
jgi:peptide/nickel transport system permease protein